VRNFKLTNFNRRTRDKTHFVLLNQEKTVIDKKAMRANEIIMCWPRAFMICLEIVEKGLFSII